MTQYASSFYVEDRHEWAKLYKHTAVQQLVHGNKISYTAYERVPKAKAGPIIWFLQGWDK